MSPGILRTGFDFGLAFEEGACRVINRSAATRGIGTVMVFDSINAGGENLNELDPTTPLLNMLAAEGGDTWPFTNVRLTVVATNQVHFNLYCVLLEEIEDDQDGMALVQGAVTANFDSGENAAQGGELTYNASGELIPLDGVIGGRKVVAISRETLTGPSKCQVWFDGLAGFGQADGDAGGV